MGGNLQVFGSERTLAAWRFHSPKPTAHSDSNSQQKTKGLEEDRIISVFFWPVQVTHRFLFHFFQIPTSTLKPMFVGFPTNSGSTRPQNVDRMTRWFPKKVRPCCIPLATLDLYLLGFGAPRQILKTLVEHPRVCWSIRHVLSGFLAYLYTASKLQVVIWQLFWDLNIHLWDYENRTLGKSPEKLPITVIPWPEFLADRCWSTN